MITFLARVISNVANPIVLFFPIPYILVYKITGDSVYATKWLEITTIFILILGAYVVYEVKIGKFTDLDVSRREQRPRLFLFMGLIGIFYLLTLYFLRGPFLLSLVTIGFMIGLFFISLINMKIKASIHVATTTAIISAVALLYGGWYFLLFLFIPLIAWSRVKTKRHTIPEVVIGAIIGLFLMLFIYGIVRFFH